MKALFPPMEADRLEALYASGLLDTPPEQAFDDIVQLSGTRENALPADGSVFALYASFQ